MNEEKQVIRRAGYGGHMKEWYTVSPTEGSGPLDCFGCHDESLYHDSIAYWDDDACDLLCLKCYSEKGEIEKSTYMKVLTYH
jgi:hypothetical protein